MLYELQVRYSPGQWTKTGVYAGTNHAMKGFDTEHYEHLSLLRARCNELDLEGRKWRFGKLTGEYLK